MIISIQRLKMSNYILITGASSGLGKSIAIELAQSGFKCILLGRSLARLNNTLSLLNGQDHLLFEGDLNDEDYLKNLIHNIPVVAGIVHAAGIIKLTPLKFINRKDFSRIMETNFFSPFFLSQAALAANKLSNSSSIVFISSISGPIIGSKGNIMYSASKSALNGIIKSLALELASKKIRVNAISAGMILTEMWTSGENAVSNEQLYEDSLKYPLGYGKPSDIASLTKFLISNESNWITGSTIIADGGFTIQ